MKIVVTYGDDKVAEVERGYPRGGVMKVCWWDDGGFGADHRFYLLQQKVVAKIIESRSRAISRAILAGGRMPCSPLLHT